MLDSVIKAVTRQLGKTFGNPYKYYVENIEQGMIKPCFVTTPRISTMRSTSPVLYNRTFPLVIHYFSDSKQNLKVDCYSMGEKVLECLEYLPFQDTLLRGEDISYELVEDVLQVFITYRFVTRKVVNEESDAMETFDETITHNN